MLKPSTYKSCATLVGLQSLPECTYNFSNPFLQVNCTFSKTSPIIAPTEETSSSIRKHHSLTKDSPPAAAKMPIHHFYACSLFLSLLIFFFPLPYCIKGRNSIASPSMEMQQWKIFAYHPAMKGTGVPARNWIATISLAGDDT